MCSSRIAQPWLLAYSPPTGNQERATSACEPYRELIEQGLSRGRNAMANLAGLDFPSRLSARLADREALCSQAARIGVATSCADPHVLLYHGNIFKCGPRSWRIKFPVEQ